MTDPTAPVPGPGILDIAPYVGGEAKAEGVERPIRLASNESALGPSPKAVAAFRACVAATAERQPRDYVRRRLAGREQMPPPRVGLLFLRHRQNPDRRPPLRDGADHLHRRAEGQHRRVAAVMIARDVPETRPRRREVDRDRKSALHPGRRGEQFAPDPHEAGGLHRPVVAGDEAAQDLRLARRLMRCDAAAALLAVGDPRDDCHALDQQILQPVIDLVDPAAQRFKIRRGV